MQNNDKVKVFSYLRCPFAMRVRMTLHEKGIPFEVKEEDLKNFSDELKSLHPEAKVPLLVHGSRAIYESAIITEYIEEAFPGPKLMPVEAGERAEVRLWTYWCNQLFKPTLDRYKYGTSRFTEKECEGAEQKLIQHSQKLEEALQKKEWLVGESISLADIHVFPFVRQLSKVTPAPPFFAQYGKVNEWLSKMANRPAFIKTMEKKQVSASGEEIASSPSAPRNDR